MLGDLKEENDAQLAWGRAGHGGWAEGRLEASQAFGALLCWEGVGCFVLCLEFLGYLEFSFGTSHGAVALCSVVKSS